MKKINKKIEISIFDDIQAFVKEKIKNEFISGFIESKIFKSFWIKFSKKKLKRLQNFIKVMLIKTQLNIQNQVQKIVKVKILVIQ
jgi:hypothetical protein